MRAPYPIEHDFWPGHTWRAAAPALVGVDGTLPRRLVAWMGEHPFIHGILLVRRGFLLFEEYGKTIDGSRTFDGNQYFNANSITKSVVSALVGIAAGAGKITLDERLGDLFPEEAATVRAAGAQEVTVRHLLTMTSGYALPSGGLDTFLLDTRSLTVMLARPMEHEPGTFWAYDDLGTHLLALALERRTAHPLSIYAQEHLFAPLGIWRDASGPTPWLRGARLVDEPHPYGLLDTRNDLLWSVDRQGHAIGSYGLQLTLPEMARFGYLYLCGGMWEGRQLLPDGYVVASWWPHIVTPKGEGYGYLWFLPAWAGTPLACAVGFGGQFIGVFPEHDLVVAVSTRILPEVQPRIWQKELITDLILPAMHD